MKHTITKQQRQPAQKVRFAGKPALLAALFAFLGMLNGTLHSQTTTLVYTGAAQTYTVPAGVTNLQLEVWGAAGGIGNYPCCQPAGNGGYAKGNITVTPGEVLTVYVGGQGASTSAAPALGGFNGGGAGFNYGNTSWIVAGGGGGTDIRRSGTALSNRVIVAGGGGGGGGSGSWGNGAGGDGGGLIGIDGHYSGQANGDGPMDSPDIYRHGKGGTQTAGGAAGSSSGNYGYYYGATAGTLGQGGNADNGSNTLSSGGGGGYYGGGGGTFHGGGGGGGSSYIGSLTSATTTSGGQTGNGQAVITVLFGAVSVQNNVSCTGGTNGSATVTAAGVPGPYTYSWVPSGGTASVATGFSAGTYTCFAYASTATTQAVVAITQPSTLSATRTRTNVSCFGGSNGSALITASGATAPYSYTWSPGGGSAASASGLIAGVYTVTINDANLCGAITQTVSITQPSVLVTSTAVTNVACNGGNGSASITASGGTSAYTYSWSSGGTSSVVTVLAGAYTATVTDANSCTSVKSVTITQPSALVTSTAVTNVLCNGGNGSATLTASGGTGAYTYSWSTGTTASVITAALAGAYTATVTDANGCTSVKAASITQPSALATSTAVTNAVCNGGNGSATITASGGNGAYTYSWTSGATTSVAAIAAGNYSVTVTDANGCTSTKSVTVTQPSTFAITGSAGSPTICNGGSTTLNGGGATNYLWTGSVTNGAAFSPTVTTTYSLTATNASACPASNTVVVTVTVNAIPTISVTSGAICTGQSFTMTASGAGTYTFSNGSAVVTPSANASYSVTGTSTAGCVSSAPAISSVTVNTLPVIAVNSGSTCSGKAFTLTASGAATYSYTGGAAVVSPTTTTSYSVTGTSSLGCVSASAAVSTITVIALPVLTVNSGSVCNGQSFSITTSGASSYTIAGGSALVSPSITTSYSVTGTNSLGCVSNSVAATVTVFALPVINVNSGSVCSGKTFTMTTSGASTYTFSNGSSTVIPTGNTSYSVTGTSTAGCISASAAVSNVTVNALPTVAATSGTICYGQVFTIIGSGASTYTVSGGSAAVSPTTTTSYPVTGTSSLGCVSANTATSTVVVNALPVLTVNSPTICTGATATLTISGAVSYSWTSPATTVVATTTAIAVSPAVTANYTVSGTDANNCTSTVIKSVLVNALPLVNISASTPTSCAGSAVLLSAGGATAYVWNTTATTASISVTPAVNTTYSVTGTDVNGCVNSKAYTATVLALPAVIISGNNALCLGGSDFLTASGAATYSWNTGATAPVIPVIPTASTTYSVSGVDLNGCVNSAIATVTVNSLPVVTISNPNSAICNGESATLTASGADTYKWNTNVTTAVIVISPIATINFTVTGTDANGCKASATATQVVSECTGITAVKGNATVISVYPNPNNGEFTISGTSNISLSIINELGQMVKNIQLDASSDNKVTVNELPNGIYFITGQSNNQVIKQKIVVAK